MVTLREPLVEASQNCHLSLFVETHPLVYASIDPSICPVRPSIHPSIQQLFVELLLYARQCSRHWVKKKLKIPVFTEFIF